MERSILLSTALSTALLVNAQLAPQQRVPLRDHLMEVNSEWSDHLTGLPDAGIPVSFINDTERIAQHLRSVHELLEARTPEGLSGDQARHRADLLLSLERYADSGRFPQNHVLPYRNPIFIDPHQTPCAVGHLMIESGATDLAVRIDAEMETAYIRDMHWPEIGDWANTHGFTSEELAWIQPGYPPPYTWSAPGGGTNGTVTVTKVLQDNRLLVAGEFTEAGGSPAGHVALWDGVEYQPLGDGVDGEVTCAIEVDGNILLGGRFHGGVHDLATWNGTSWTYEAAFASKSAYISALHVHDGVLYAAGSLQGFAGEDDAVQRRSTSGWAIVGSIFNGPIHELASHDGKLVAAGAFTGLDGVGDPVCQRVAVLEGSDWQQLADGLDAPVYALLDMDGMLYAGGEFYDNGEPAFGFARIGVAGASWESLYPNHPFIVNDFMGQTRITTIARKGGVILFGGSFRIAQLGETFGQNAAIWEGEPDEAQALIAWMYDPVNCLAAQGNTIYLGGPFTTIGGPSPFALPFIATSEITTSLGEERTPLTFTLSPNPAAEVLTVHFPARMDPTTPLRIIDASGRVVNAIVECNGDRVDMDVRGLATGTYQVEATDGNLMVKGRFVKQ
ncbi:MAG TPA: T9SS type A sorting domain-containing protein [Flavobacteriales bacterium]|nr:T9SS type A sorting domain-containing protein [Flavobacteriales bacterium]